MNKQKGISQIVVMVVMLILAIALPITTKLVQKSQENRSKAAGEMVNGETCTYEKSGTRTCVGNVVYFCTVGSDRMPYWQSSTDCAKTGQTCSVGVCVSNTATSTCTSNDGRTIQNNAVFCESAANTRVYVCVNGTKEYRGLDCASTGRVCSNGTCVDKPTSTTCTAATATGSKFCNGNMIYKYCTGSSGDGAYVETCSGNCSSGACVTSGGTGIVQDAKCVNVGGVCQKTTTACTNGKTYLTNYCMSSGTDIKCCAPALSADKPCTDKDGICRVWETSTVGGSCNNGTGKIEKGLCMSQPTNTSYRCCVPNPVAPAPTGCGGNDLNCPDHQICNSSNACVPSYTGYPCSRDTQCLSTMKCISGKCATPVAPTAVPTTKPTTVPTSVPTAVPTTKPTATPTQTPVCTSGVKECTSASAYRVCVNGFWGAATSCGAATPLCTGSGVCQAKTAAEATVTVKMAFAGVKPGNDQCVTNIWPVVFRIVNESGANVLSTELRGIPQKTGSVNSAGEIIYTLSTTVNDVPDNGVSKLALFMKGPKHISMKYGVNNQQSWYQSYVGQLSLAVGANSYDFSNFSLLAGDVTGETTGVPDGKIDARDFSFIKEKSQPITEGTVGVDLIGDIDGNCQVNSGDVKLIKESLVEQNGQIY